MGFCKVLSICGILFLVALVHTELIRIPLKKTKSPRHVLAEMHVKGTFPKWFKYNYFSKPKPKTNGTIPLFKYMDSEFYGEVCIGHPCQKFKVIFDTAWINTWIPSAKCSVFNVPCMIHNRYKSDMSSTYVANGTKISIPVGGESSLEGILSQDTVHLGQLTANNQTFAEMTYLPYMYTFSKADGIVGLGYNSYSLLGVMPLFYNLIKQHKEIRPIFSLYINRDMTTNKGGSLFIGGSEKKHFRNASFTYTAVTRKAYWQFRMQQINVLVSPPHKAIAFCVGGCNVFMDSSTSTITGPEKEIKKINDLIKATAVLFGRYKVPCSMVNKLPEIYFIIEGKNFTLKGRDYVQQIHMGAAVICLSAFQKTELPPPDDRYWSLGATFIAKYYTEFDMENNRLGFAMANH